MCSYKTFSSCKNNTGLFELLELDEVFDLDQLFNMSQYNDLLTGQFDQIGDLLTGQMEELTSSSQIEELLKIKGEFNLRPRKSGAIGHF